MGLGGLGERFSSPSGSGRSPAAKRILVHFELKYITFHFTQELILEGLEQKLGVGGLEPLSPIASAATGPTLTAKLLLFKFDARCAYM